MKIKLKLILIFFITIIFTFKNLSSQHFDWVKSISGNSDEYGRSICVDKDGNIYATGYFYGTVDFDPGNGTFLLSSSGRFDIFVVKLNKDGNFLWAKTFGGTSDDYATFIKTDNNGNVYTTGYFEGTADFDPSDDTLKIKSLRNSDVFIHKMDSDGNFLWVRTIEGLGDERAISLCIDNQDNVYNIGNFRGTVDFDPGSNKVEFSSQGNDDIFILKLDSEGNYIWTKTFGGEKNDYPTSIDVDKQGNIYTLGFFEGTADFDPNEKETVISSNGWKDIFVHKMDSEGNFLWAKTFGGKEEDSAYFINIDNKNDIYITGFFRDTVYLSNGEELLNLKNDAFIMKIDLNGEIIWVKYFPGDYGFDYGRTIDFDEYGNVYTSGIFNDTVDFDPGVGKVYIDPIGDDDNFIHKMDSDGNFIWVNTFGGTGNVSKYPFSVNSNRNIYTLSSFDEMIKFNTKKGLDSLSSSVKFDIIILKMSENITGILELGNGIQISAYPNPNEGSVNLSFEKVFNDIDIILTDLNGKILSSKHLEYTKNEEILINGKSGVYFLKIKTPQGQSVVKLIKE
jgi:hypothetical protein